MRKGQLGLSALAGVVLALCLMPAVASAAPAAPAAEKPQPIKPEDIKAGMAAAPSLVSQGGIDCQVANARKLGEDTKTHSTYYELACKGGEGFIIAQPAKDAKTPMLIFTCLEVAGAKGGATCALPENVDPKAGLAALVAKYEPSCQMTGARGIGHNDQVIRFEVACQGGAGYIVDTAYPLTVAKPATFSPCAGLEPGMQTQCTLTDAAATSAYLASLVGKMGKPCDMKDHRYVGADAKGATYFEVACKDGKGYMLEVANTGGVTPIDCTQADNIGNGCTLTNAREAQTEEAALYSKLAHSAGFPCDVSKYSPFEVNVPGHEVVELACSNRQDGAVAVLPVSSAAGGKSIVYDCIHSQVAGYRCSFTKEDAALPGLTADLKALGKTSCVVSGARFIARTVDNSGYVEVACADGNPGYIIEYSAPPLSPTTPTRAIPCVSASDVEGGCTMPSNQKKG